MMFSNYDFSARMFWCTVIIGLCFYFGGCATAPESDEYQHITDREYERGVRQTKDREKILWIMENCPGYHYRGPSTARERMLMARGKLLIPRHAHPIHYTCNPRDTLW